MPECRSCHAQIIFVKSMTGRMMPLDALPNPKGNIRIVEVDGERRCTVAAPDPDDDGVAIGDDDNPYRGKRFMSHFVTCTNPDQHRTGR